MLGLASDVFESYSAGTEIKSSINQDAANVYQEMAELLRITLKQLMDFVMTMMVYTQGIGTLIASGIVKDTKENMYRMLHNTGMTYLCPVCGAKTRTQIMDDTELKHFPLFCSKCKENFIIFVKCKSNTYCSI